MHPSAVVALAVLVAMSGCESKASSPPPPPIATKPTSARAPLVELTASSTLAPIRTAFNAHKGEARFLTLLSPT